MSIIIKYIIKSMCEKKLRTLLIMLAILLSGALCFASMGITDSVMKLYEDNAKASIGNADLKITANGKSPSEYVNLGPSRQLSKETNYIIPTINTSAYYKVGQEVYDEMHLIGITLEDYMRMNTLELIRVSKSLAFEGSNIIISAKTADKYGFQVGDSLEVRLKDKRKRYIIYGVTTNVGIFKNEGDTPLLMVPYEELSSNLGADNRATILYIKATGGKDLRVLMESIKKLYPKYEVSEAMDLGSFREILTSFSTMLVMMAVIITMMSLFIVYSSFKVIMLEKMPVIGTFRSIGASKQMVNRVLLLEGSFYGVLGGVLASLVGVGILKGIVMAMMVALKGEVVTGKVVLKPSYFIGTFLLCLLICLLSSLFPILKISKIPVKEIVLGGTEKMKGRRFWKDIFYLLIVGFSIWGTQVVPEQLSLVAGSLSLILCILGVIGVLPLIVKWTTGLIESLFGSLFGNIGLLAIKNIKDNKSIRNSLTLIVIGVGILLMINNFGQNLAVEIVNAYEKSFAYSLEIKMDRMTKIDVRALYYEEGIKEAYGNIEGGVFAGQKTLLVDYDNAPILSVEAVQGERHGKYKTYTYVSEEAKREILNSLREGRNIAVASILKKRYNLEKGQLLRLELPEGIRTYRIVGFFDTLMNNGNMVQIGENYYRQDFASHNYTSIYLKTSHEPDAVLEYLKMKYRDRHLQGRSLQNQIKDNADSNASVMMVLSTLSLLAVLIGIVGIINNLFISFIERKRSIAVYRSVGMSKKQVLQMIFLEALYTGSMGASVGIGMGWIMMKNLPYALELIQMPPVAYFIGEGIGVYLMMATLVTVVASISPAFKSSKLNIIEAIKFE
ncbi:hypothetical protein CS063_08490 [Sporanaerobium hydrogeniformans]|uniref:Uncharacterized protein n=1 Tax=Sporanaerobium hydrogeniformans TaxID=3072179 RepID=A0AC61DDM2_9FIRM|nr:FtsX-like permease family protein [Sporanaerobium hydrogeniformans]PHV70796.1 hypothetical protein CS063_08490 [Sporanaerobium hydrogeniformans]